MKTREEILAELQEGLRSGILTEADIQPFVTIRQEASLTPAFEQENKPERLSAVDVMFYVAGIVLFSAIVSIIVQSWNDGNAFAHIFSSAVVGIGLWLIAFYLIKSPLQSDIRRGLTNALLLTGSLLVVLGGYIVTNEIIGGFGTVNYIPAAFMLIILAGLHIAFDKLIKQDLILLMGVLLGVASFPTLLFGLLQTFNVSIDVWMMIFVFSSALLVYATRVVAKVNPDRKISNSFDSFAAFLALLSMYVAGYGDYGVLWFGILIAAIFGIFYLSIIMQNKHLLGSGTFFMVLTIVTISFKYFSGYGITFSLIVATLGLLGSAAVASSIHKKYFKQST